MVRRVEIEMQTSGGKADKNFNINWSWNVIRQIFDMKEFVPAFVHEMEVLVHPLLEHVQNI